jgi:DNA repair protein RecO (recombination protein O)
MRQNRGMDNAYVLHTYPYRETSLILQAWTEKHGRLGLVAKGARRPKSASRSLLVPFQPLVVDWFGKGELRTLKTVEPAAPATPLAGQALLSAFYLNELLLKLTTRDDPHEQLFAAYDEAVCALRAISRGGAQGVEPVLRRFELALLREVGYALELTREAGTHAPIVAEREYFYVVERGAVPAEQAEPRADAVRLSGLTLLHLERGRFEDEKTIAQAKSLMRLLINHSLNGRELATRAMVRDLQALDEQPSPRREGDRSRPSPGNDPSPDEGGRS